MTKGLLRFLKPLILPLSALLILVVFDFIWFNLINHVNFFSVVMRTNNDGNKVLAGNIIDILNGASELAIIAIGMTLVTASSRGQDISVGAVAAIAGSVFVSVLGHQITVPTILVAFLSACGAALICGAFNGTLVAIFKIQPMIATLILFSAGRPIAYWINGGRTPTVDSPLLDYVGKVIPGIPIPTPIIIVILFVVLVSFVLRFTNLRLYTQAVGINEKSARLNGINAVWIKFSAFMILGVCAAIAGSINVCKIGVINYESIVLDIEMYAILAVAIGGNVLGGGKFSLTGSVIGAYVIQTLTTTLYAVKVPPTALKACMAVVIIIIVLLGSPIVKDYALQLRDKLFKPSMFKQLEKSTKATENQ
jgi:ribose/xylose/arabinose/galactoside ABC-type transport system permease subunit